MKNNMIKILLLGMLFLGCQSPKKAPKPQHDKLTEDEPYMVVDYAYGLELTTIGPVDVSRIRTTKGVFTVLGHITYRKWTKVYMQGDFLFVYDEDKILKKHKLM